MSTPKKVFDVTSPSSTTPSITIEKRRRVMMDDIQDKRVTEKPSRPTISDFTPPPTRESTATKPIVDKAPDSQQVEEKIIVRKKTVEPIESADDESTRSTVLTQEDTEIKVLEDDEKAISDLLELNDAKPDIPSFTVVDTTSVKLSQSDTSDTSESREEPAAPLVTMVDQSPPEFTLEPQVESVQDSIPEAPVTTSNLELSSDNVANTDDTATTLGSSAKNESRAVDDSRATDQMDAKSKPTASEAESPEHIVPATGFAVSEAVPDIDQKMTADHQQNMDQPLAFDTTQYFVPIGVTTHKHGHLIESLIFGALLTVMVFGVLYYFFG